MPQLVHTNEPLDIQTDSSAKQTLAPKMAEDAVVRLYWICLLCVVLAAFSAIFQSILQPEIIERMMNAPVYLTWSFVLLFTLAIGIIRHLRLLPPMTILNLGLVFEVLVAFAISLAETAVPLCEHGPVLGIPKVALWIAVVGLLIPNRPKTKLAVAFISASMWPLAYALNLNLHGYAAVELKRLLVWIHVPYLMAFVTYALAKRIYVMEAAAQKARDLGSYNLVSLIGSGGMGEVWRAQHRMLARDAAIKLIRSDLLMGKPGYQSDVARKRFKREAQAIASLQSPHTVYLFDFGVSRDGTFYYVMELLDGISLQMLVDKYGPQPASRLVHILRQVCHSLEEAHRRGLVHRDIKPSNIFACKIGIEHDFMKVLDFGLVKNLSPKDSLQLTLEGASAGTPAYMAPELAMGEDGIDGRVDIYALGCVAYFLLTGSPVFTEKTATATALAHVQKEPVPPSQRSEMQIPSRLEQIILRCLAKKAEDRPQTALELESLFADCGAEKWTQEDAAEWWQTYLPESSSYRMARRLRSVEPLSLNEE
ncbi:MAG: serine/threonine protein kinase [Acidobacteria bacterium]|nr:serine/threonine protein kinase [Acidobacteriota bacterium]